LPLSTVTRLTRRVPLVEQELLILPEHMSSPPVFSRVRVTRSLVLYICFVDRCLFLCTFSSGHCVVCSSLIFWLPLWYLQTLLSNYLETDSLFGAGNSGVNEENLTPTYRKPPTNFIGRIQQVVKISRFSYIQYRNRHYLLVFIATTAILRIAKLKRLVYIIRNIYP
jgi:hypothetical protein